MPPPSEVAGVILLNPPAPSVNMDALLDADAGRQGIVVWGEMRDDAGLTKWEELARDHPTVQVVEAPGAAL